MLIALQEILRELPGTDNDISPMPQQQLLVLIIDHLEQFEKTQPGTYTGFMDFLKSHFSKKQNGGIGNGQMVISKTFKPYLLGVLKYSKEEGEIKFFAKLMNSNANHFLCSSICKAIQIFRKYFVEFFSKGNHNFRKVKVKIQDLYKYLCQIYSTHTLTTRIPN